MKNRNIDYNHKVLEVKDLKQYFKVGFGSRKMIIKAVDGISFDIYKREVFGLVGESGCGKTTTGRTIIKIYDATDGTVTYNGKIITAGLLGNKERIKKAKNDCKFEIIQQMPLKKEIFEIKQNEKNTITKLNRDIERLNKQLKMEVEHIQNLTKELNNQLDLALHHYETKLNATKRKQLAEINRVKEQDIKDLFRMHNKTIHMINKKQTEKVNYIKSLPADSKEINQKLNDATITHQENLKAAIDRLISNIKQINPLVLVEYEERIKATKHIKYHSRANLKSMEVKNTIEGINTKYNAIFNELKASYEKQLDQIKTNQPHIEHSNVSELELSIKVKIDDLKNQIQHVKNETKKLINEAKVLAKENPAKYVNNDQAITEIKTKYAKIIANEKELIKKKRAVKRQVDTKTMSTMQMVFQDPIASLNPRMIVRDIISEGLVVRGEKDKKLINEKVERILDTVGLSPDHATRYPHEFSGGQRQRIGVARALIVEPDFIIADEPISALDVSIQAQVINLLNDLKDELGLTILFIAHDLSVVKYFCDRIAVMYYGKIVELASSEELFNNPLHPYTKSLLSAIPQPDPKSESTRVRLTYNPSIHDYSHDQPKLLEIKPGHFIYANKKEYEQYQKELGLK